MATNIFYYPMYGIWLYGKKITKLMTGRKIIYWNVNRRTLFDYKSGIREKIGSIRHTIYFETVESYFKGFYFENVW